MNATKMDVLDICRGITLTHHEQTDGAWPALSDAGMTGDLHACNNDLKNSDQI